MILVLDFGGQYTQLIARKVRELSVKSVILPFNAPIAEMKSLAPEGVILSGGPASIFAPGAPQLNPKIFDLGIPVLGICYGLQAAARLFGGKVARGKAGEYGRAQLSIRKADPFFAGVKAKSLNVWMSHFDRVDALPKGFTVTASTDHCPFAAASDPARKFWGVQFHPEVHHTEEGKRLLSNFVLRVCGAKANWR